VKEISAAIQQMAIGSQQIVAAVKEIDGHSKAAVGKTQTVSAIGLFEIRIAEILLFQLNW
jgi:hypothetical protein